MSFLDALGAAGSGAVDGFGAGLDMRSGLDKLREVRAARQRTSDAKSAVTRANLTPELPPAGPPPSLPMGAGPGIPVGMDGAPPLPGAGPMPQPPMPGQSSLPANPGPSPMAAPAGPGQPLPQQPVSQAQPIQAPLSGVAEPAGSFFADTQKTLQGMFKQIQQANPNLDPETAFDAVAAQVEMLQGVDQSAKVYMQSSVAQAKIDAQFQIQAAKADSAREVAELRAEAAVLKAQIAANAARDVAGIRGGTQRDVANINREGRIGAADIAADSRRDVADKQADASRYRDDKKYQGLVYDNVLKAYVEADKARVAADARVDAAGVMAGREPRTPAYAGPRVRGAGGNAAPSRTPIGQERRPAAAPAYKSLAELQQAFQAGKVDAATAQKIAKQNGWAR